LSAELTKNALLQTVFFPILPTDWRSRIYARKAIVSETKKKLNRK